VQAVVAQALLSRTSRHHRRHHQQQQQQQQRQQQRHHHQPQHAATLGLLQSSRGHLLQLLMLMSGSLALQLQAAQSAAASTATVHVSLVRTCCPLLPQRAGLLAVLMWVCQMPPQQQTLRLAPQQHH
jgi:hypothetical protein